MIRVGVLGDVSLEIDGRAVLLSARQERAILALLALGIGQAVSVDALIDGLWGDEPPANARKAVQTYVTRLRKHLPRDTIESAGAGYRLHRERCEVDAHQFEQLAEQGRGELNGEQWARSVASLGTALSLWRGALLPELLDAPTTAGARTRLGELRLAAEDDLLEARLGLGEHHAVVGAAEDAVAREPLRERRWAQLMLALYRSGRQGDALRAFQRCRAALADELGVEPGPELRSLEGRILNQDDALAHPLSLARPRTAPLGLPPILAEAARKPMVGRSRQLGEIDAAWAEVLDGARRTVVLCGEAGAGKTRLAAALAERAEASGATVLCGRCQPELSLPFQPFVEALLPLRGSPVVNNMDGLAELLDSSPGPQTGKEPDGHLRQERPQYRTFEAVVQVLATLAESAPVVLVAEDCHWATGPVQRMLRHLVSSPELTRVLIVATLRDAAPVSLNDLSELSGVRRIALDALTVDEVGAMVAQRVGDDLALAAQVHDLAGGNPFLVEQLLLDHQAGENVTSHASRGNDVVAARVERLSLQTRGVLQLAALAGPSFPVSVLMAASEAGRDGVLDALEEAESAGLVTPDPTELGRFAFCHALVRSALVDSLPASRRMRLHRDLAVALEPRANDPDQVGLLAQHSAAAAPLGLAASAIKHGRRAGQLCRQRAAFEEAAAYYDLALHAVEHADAIDERVRCDLLIGRGEALRRVNDPQHEAVLGEAVSLARRLDDPRRLAAVVFASRRRFLGEYDLARWETELVALADEALRGLHDEEPALRAHLLAIVATEHMHSPPGDTRCEEAGRAAVELAREAGDTALLAEVLVCRVFAWTEVHNPHGRLALAEEAAALADELGDDELSFRAHLHLAAARRVFFDLAGCGQAYSRARELCDTLRDPMLQTMLLSHQAGERSLTGDMEGTARLMDEAVEVGRRGGLSELGMAVGRFVSTCRLLWDRGEFDVFRATADAIVTVIPDPTYRVVRALVLCQQGELDEAREDFERVAEPDFVTILRRFTWPFFTGISAEVAAELGDRRRCERLLDALRPIAGTVISVDSPLVWDLVDRVVGRMHTVTGDYDEAARSLGSALEQSRQLNAPLFAARTHVDLARLAAAQGDTAAADEHCSTAIQLAEPLGGHGVIAAADRVTTANPRA